MRHVGVAAVVLLAVHSTLGAQLATPVTTKTPSGIPRVMSAGPTAWKDTLGWKLVLDHTIQPPDGAKGALGSPTQIGLLADGSVVVLDDSPLQLSLYDTKGNFVRTIGRRGGGPGEYQQPELANNASLIVVHDPGSTRTTVYNAEGKIIRSYTSTTGSFGLRPYIDAQNRVSSSSYTQIGEKRSSAWTVFDSTGRRVDSLLSPAAFEAKRWIIKSGNGVSAFNIPFAAENLHANLPDGTIVHGRNDRYELMITRNGSDTVRIFGRTGVKAVPIPSSLRDSVFQAKISRSAPLRGIAQASDIPDTYELWRDLATDGQRNIWVGTGGRWAPRLFDVFSPSGAFLGSVPRPWGSFMDTSWQSDRVAVLEADANDLPRIRVFRIVRTVNR